jgi:hypothetical protein
MKTVVIFAICALVILSGCGEKKDYSDFAKCLTKNNLRMFGAYWCPHCTSVKESFGNAFAYINYTECDGGVPDGNPDVCRAEGIEYMPTFKFRDNTKLIGEVGFDILSSKTGCPLPP